MHIQLIQFPFWLGVWSGVICVLLIAACALVKEEEFGLDLEMCAIVLTVFTLLAETCFYLATMQPIEAVNVFAAFIVATVLAFLAVNGAVGFYRGLTRPVEIVA